MIPHNIETIFSGAIGALTVFIFGAALTVYEKQKLELNRTLQLITILTDQRVELTSLSQFLNLLIKKIKQFEADKKINWDLFAVLTMVSKSPSMYFNLEHESSISRISLEAIFAQHQINDRIKSVIEKLDRHQVQYDKLYTEFKNKVPLDKAEWFVRYSANVIDSLKEDLQTINKESKKLAALILASFKSFLFINWRYRKDLKRAKKVTERVMGFLEIDSEESE